MDESTLTPAFNKIAPRQDTTKAIYEEFEARGRKQIAIAKTCKPPTLPQRSDPLFAIKPLENTDLNVMSFDAEQFLHHFEGMEISEEDQKDVLYALWQIMCRFVELSFGMESHNLTCGQTGKKAPRNEDIMINSNPTEK